MLALALVLAALVGLCLGLLGSGGSIVTLPVLVYVARVPAHQAVGMSLVIVGATSAVGSLVNLRRGAFDLRAGAFFAATGIVGAFFGAKFTHMVSARVLLLCFGGLMSIVGLRMLLGSQDAPPGRAVQTFALPGRRRCGRSPHRFSRRGWRVRYFTRAGALCRAGDEGGHRHFAGGDRREFFRGPGRAAPLRAI